MRVSLGGRWVVVAVVLLARVVRFCRGALVLAVPILVGRVVRVADPVGGSVVVRVAGFAVELVLGITAALVWGGVLPPARVAVNRARYVMLMLVLRILGMLRMLERLVVLMLRSLVVLIMMDLLWL